MISTVWQISPMKKLTMRQQECLLVVKHWLRVYGKAPSHGEIARSMKARNGSTARSHLRALERKGFVRLTTYEHRGIEVLK
jgi:repressor LexA